MSRIVIPTIVAYYWLVVISRTALFTVSAAESRDRVSWKPEVLCPMGMDVVGIWSVVVGIEWMWWATRSPVISHISFAIVFIRTWSTRPTAPNKLWVSRSRCINWGFRASQVIAQPHCAMHISKPRWIQIPFHRAQLGTIKQKSTREHDGFQCKLWRVSQAELFLPWSESALFRLLKMPISGNELKKMWRKDLKRIGGGGKKGSRDHTSAALLRHSDWLGRRKRQSPNFPDQSPLHYVTINLIQSSLSSIWFCNLRATNGHPNNGTRAIKPKRPYYSKGELKIPPTKSNPNFVPIFKFRINWRSFFFNFNFPLPIDL